MTVVVNNNVRRIVFPNRKIAHAIRSTGDFTVTACGRTNNHVGYVIVSADRFVTDGSACATCVKIVARSQSEQLRTRSVNSVVGWYKTRDNHLLQVAAGNRTGMVTVTRQSGPTYSTVGMPTVTECDVQEFLSNKIDFGWEPVSDLAALLAGTYRFGRSGDYIRFLPNGNDSELMDGTFANGMESPCWLATNIAELVLNRKLNRVESELFRLEFIFDNYTDYGSETLGYGTLADIIDIVRSDFLGELKTIQRGIESGIETDYWNRRKFYVERAIGWVAELMRENRTVPSPEMMPTVGNYVAFTVFDWK